MKKLLREPLLHFVLLGAAIFVLYYIVQKDNAGENEIAITNSDVAHIAALYEAQWHRSPTSEELTKLISAQIRREVYYREALRLDLEKNDEVVKQRLAQKMEFLSNDLTALNETPYDNELEKWFDKNRDAYMTPWVFSFDQIVFTPERHKNTRESAAEALQNNQNTEPDEMKKQGDQVSLPFHNQQQSTPEIQVNFGKEMADTLSQLPLDKWIDPIESAYGWHLVFVTSRTPPHLPDFSTVKATVKNDYQTEKEKRNKSEVYRELLENYEIELKADTLNTAMRKKINAEITGEI